MILHHLWGRIYFINNEVNSLSNLALSNGVDVDSTLVEDEGTLSSDALLSRNTIAQSIRDQVKENQSHAADKMCKKHDKKRNH